MIRLGQDDGGKSLPLCRCHQARRRVVIEGEPGPVDSLHDGWGGRRSQVRQHGIHGSFRVFGPGLQWCVGAHSVAGYGAGDGVLQAQPHEAAWGAGSGRFDVQLREIPGQPVLVMIVDMLVDDGAGRVKSCSAVGVNNGIFERIGLKAGGIGQNHAVGKYRSRKFAWIMERR